MKKIFLSIVVMCTCLLMEAQIDTVINRYKYYLVSTSDKADVKHLMNTLNSNGQWGDIDYNDAERAEWKPWSHLKRLRSLAVEWANEKSEYYHNNEVRKKIDDALNHWLQKRYKNSNWWHNQIGIPQCMRDIIILLRNDLKADQLKQSLEIMNQLNVLPSGYGANLIWSADLGLHYGALTNNITLMDSCIKKLVNEVAITEAEGIQPDYSFHQHGKRLQMYQYGAAYFVEGARIAWEVRNTQWAYPKEKVDIYAGFALNGWQWMARGINTVPGTIDRSASRIDALHSADIRKLLPFLCELSPDNADAFRKVLAIQNGNGSLNGYRYYPRSDFDAYHQKDFSFFVKTISTRTLATESINNENLEGKLLNSGDAYIIRTGDEYFNMMPVWNWEKLPGITAFAGADKINRKPFVGSVSNESSGMCVMDYVMATKDEKQTLSTKKSWISHNGLVIALIAGIETNNINSETYTVLDQCRLNGNVAMNSVGNILDAGTRKMSSVQWLHHNGVGYIPLQPSSFEIKNDTVSGSWNAINLSISPKKIIDKVFMPVMMHSNNEASGFVYVCTTPKGTKKLAGRPLWTILKNDRTCQAVQFKDGTLMAAFYNEGELTANKNQTLRVSKNCVVMIDKADKIYVSNPMHAVENISIEWKGKTYTVQVPGDGTTKEVFANVD